MLRPSETFGKVTQRTDRRDNSRVERDTPVPQTLVYET